MTKRKKLFILAAVLAVAIGIVAFFILNRDKEQAPEPESEKFYSQLTGNEVSREDALRPILGVMIENSEASRPQTGLSSAGIVFETVTEGGITRFLALYQEDMPERVGPVRSVRPAFVDWLLGFDASIAHVGGSATALEMINSRQAKALNQFAHPEPYTRINNRPAPHNMYASTEKLRGLQAELGHNRSDAQEFQRSDDAPTEEPDAVRVDVSFSSPSFATQYRYDPETNAYTRYLAGQPHVDTATDQPIQVKNLIVLRMPANLTGIGSGEAFLFKDGTVHKITWQKTDYDEELQLLDDAGQPVALNRGMTWFAGIPRTGSVNY